MEPEKKVDFEKIERKWQSQWEKEKAFEPKIDKKKKKLFYTTPYPYISGSLHIGHGRSVTESDIYCRYKRMEGFNVLFPMAFHITGTPVLGISAAIKNKDKEKIKLYEGYVSAYENDKEKIKKIVKSFEEPQSIVDFFIPKMIEEYKQIGLSIDWTRKFTSGDIEHQSLVDWQFNKYKEKNYLIKSKYPVLYSPMDQSAMGEDDIVDADSNPVEKQDFIWIKFKMKNSDLILMAGTTRPDALYGQTNLWIDPMGKYVIVKVKNEKWVVGREAVEKIKYQYIQPEIIKEISPKELIGKWVRGPLMDKDIHVLPAEFIKSGIGSGIVYSALEDPVDLFELKKIQSNDKFIKTYSLDKEEVKRLKPIDIIKVDGLGNNLGESIGKQFGVKSSEDKELLEKAKNELNKIVFRKGIMRENCGSCAGMNVPQAQRFLKEKLTNDGEAVMFYEVSREAFSRSGGKIIVAVLDNQWFLDFNAPGWKEKAFDCLSKMEIVPEKMRKQFEDTFNWLDKRPCARKRGLGTKLPFDKEWIIESLSDSTIYMTLYSINNIIRENKLTVDNLTYELFEYLFLNKGELKEVCKKTKIKESIIKEMKESYEYWMPVDHRHTFPLHLSNHLSFMIFAYASIFPEKYWPKKISFHGLVVSNGQKMSKSKGNLITLLKVKKEYGADVFRFYMTSSSNLEGSFDWKEQEAKNAKRTIQKLYFQILECINERNKGKVKPILESKFNRLIKEASNRISGMQLREYDSLVVYDMLNIVKDARLQLDKKDLGAFYNLILENWIKLISPVVPHIAEELWSKLGKKSLVSLEEWPEADESKISENLEIEEKMQEQIIEDIKNILNIIRERENKEGEKIYLYAIPKDVGVYNIPYLEKKLNKEVKIFAVNDAKRYDPENKSSKAKLGKPAIYIE